MKYEYGRDIRLFDSQWMNIVNADYNGMTLEEAVNAAVKATEEQMARNYHEDRWPEPC